MKITDITGQKFGFWTVVSQADPVKHETKWLCMCRCGKLAEVYTKALRRGTSTSCGCVRRELSRDRATIHGMSKSVEYRTWRRIRDRCFNPLSGDYADYGGRGIRVCEEWSSFPAFLSDMGIRPSRNHSINRVNNDGHYEPTNCKWSTPIEQANNKRNNRRITWRGETLNLVQWAARTGINADVIYQRLGKLGWSIEQSLTRAVR